MASLSLTNKPIVLIAEDDSDLLRMISRLLSTIVEVREASDGQQALEMLLSMSPLPTLVITDMMMPRMDGIMLAKSIKASPQLAKIPIIMLTAKGTPRDQIIGINAGVRHYMTKPFKHDDLISKVKKIANIK